MVVVTPALEYNRGFGVNSWLIPDLTRAHICRETCTWLRRSAAAVGSSGVRRDPWPGSRCPSYLLRPSASLACGIAGERCTGTDWWAVPGAEEPGSESPGVLLALCRREILWKISPRAAVFKDKSCRLSAAARQPGDLCPSAESSSLIG